jgi:hypothetical protein
MSAGGLLLRGKAPSDEVYRTHYQRPRRFFPFKILIRQFEGKAPEALSPMTIDYVGSLDDAAAICAALLTWAKLILARSNSPNALHSPDNAVL